MAKHTALLALLLGLLAVQFSTASVVEPFQNVIDEMTAADGEAPFVASTMLDGSKQVPAPVDTNTTAEFFLAIGKTSAAWALEIVGVEHLIMAHIHNGNDSTNGAPIVLLGPGGATSALAALDLPTYDPAMSGTIRMSSTFNDTNIANFPGVTTLKGLQDEIVAGNVYVNVHTVDAPAGLIRGQVEPELM